MTIFKNILVPVDFSDGSCAALKLALELGKAFDAHIRVLHVWQPPEFAGADLMVLAHSDGLSIGEYGQQKAAEAMEQLLDKCGASAAVDTSVTIGDPRYAIVDLADSLHADLIVMGTQGRTGRARMFAGSVAEAVVRRAHVPVLTVHKPQPQ
ncbi:MAG: universal stress protein [Polyangiaceae bacterium]